MSSTKPAKMNVVHVVIASDHGGFTLKKEVLSALKKLGVTFKDLGTHSEESVDYPDFAKQVAEKVASGKADRGILICGTGAGMCIAANKFKGIRASLVPDLYTAQMTREHNDLNVLCLGGRVTPAETAKEITKIFLETPFAGGRHERRVGKIKNFENK
ncbi:MAG: ribose 5-phosphate isomerase B [Deltaproteobacteria bacterium]|nr:ribose 5-phosphate isomerase B [Deltaproteobacteria bacterium]